MFRECYHGDLACHLSSRLKTKSPLHHSRSPAFLLFTHTFHSFQNAWHEMKHLIAYSWKRNQWVTQLLIVIVVMKRRSRGTITCIVRRARSLTALNIARCVNKALNKLATADDAMTARGLPLKRSSCSFLLTRTKAKQAYDVWMTTTMVMIEWLVTMEGPLDHWNTFSHKSTSHFIACQVGWSVG